MPLLETKSLSKQFGGLTAVKEVSFSVEEGEIVGLIGPNGAGKTTLFNMVAGTYPPTSGDVVYGGREITGMQSFEVARLGISRTFQNIRLFKDLTVAENVYIGGLRLFHSGLYGGLLGLPHPKRESSALWQEVGEILRFLGIDHLADHLASSLPYGHQRLLEIARALAGKPRLLLLDEPTAGMNPNETQEVMDTIRQVRDKGVTVLVIEHDMRLVMGICERVVVLNYGQKIAEGPPVDIQANPRVIEAYLGSGHKYA